MSSIITGESISGMQLPVTWAALAALLQTIILCVPGTIWAGGISARVGGLERDRESVKTETARQFDRTNQQLDRLEAKVDAMILELRKR